VAPHHLLLTEENVRDYDTNYKVNPPLRTAADTEALRQAIKEGLSMHWPVITHRT
jgi:dihydroorotase